MSSPDHFQAKTAYLDGPTVTEAEQAAALAYLQAADATDCAEALGLAPYVGHARVYRNGPSRTCCPRPPCRTPTAPARTVMAAWTCGRP